MKKPLITRRMSKGTLQSIARRECANYNNKLCLGIIMQSKKTKEGTKLYMWKDDDMAGKPCSVEKGCGYFDTIVTPGL